MTGSTYIAACQPLRASPMYVKGEYVIDVNLETVICLTEAAKRLPTRRGKRPVNVSCLYRWTTQGCRGVVLECIQIGGTRCTSIEAMQRFFERLTPMADPMRDTAQLPSSQRAASTARDLDRLGI